MQAVVKAVSSVVVGAVAAPYLIWCWAQVAGRSLILDPLLALGLRDTSLYVAIAGADFLASVLMLLPFALVLRCLGMSRLLLHTSLAALVMLIISFAIVGLPALPSTWQTLASNMSPYVALFASVWICVAVTGHPPNNSFKPTPLRGAA